MPPKKKKTSSTRRRRGTTAPPAGGGAGSLRDRLGIASPSAQPRRQLQHTSEVAARLSPSQKKREIAEMGAMLSGSGYAPRYAAQLFADGMGPLELEHRLRTPPADRGSLVYTHDIPHPSRIPRRLPGDRSLAPIEPDNTGGANSDWNRRHHPRPVEMSGGPEGSCPMCAMLESGEHCTLCEGS